MSLKKLFSKIVIFSRVLLAIDFCWGISKREFNLIKNNSAEFVREKKTCI